MDNIKQCPFCSWGAPAALIKEDAGFTGINGDEVFNYYVQCEYCHARGPISITEKSAIRRWNLARRR